MANEEEPMELIDVSNIKTEPDDEETDNIFEPIIIKDEFDIKLEIKEEPEETAEIFHCTIPDREEDSMSPPPMSNPLSPDSTCRVEILEQPIKKVRFRYLSELQGTPHGPLLGEKSTKTNKTFPVVRLVGYEGLCCNVKIRCWLVDVATMPVKKIRPHCHDLVVRKCNLKNEIISEPHEVLVGRTNNYTAIFENMVVLHCVQKDCESKYAEKEWRWVNRYQTNPVTMARYDPKKIRETIKNINKNEVCLYFEAYIESRNSIEILCHTLSNPIKNLKNPISGDLRICRVLNNYGPSSGNTEVGVFSEKVPIDVKIKMFRTRNPQFEEFITPEYIHRNLALTFRTPSLPFDIEDEMKAEFCLFRESDSAESNYMEFTFHPTKYISNSNKRRRLDSGPHPVNSSNLEIVDEVISLKKPLQPINKVVGQTKATNSVDNEILKSINEPPVLCKLFSRNQVNTLRTLKPSALSPSVLSSQNNAKKPAKVFHVSKLKFQKYLKLMKSKGYVVKSIT